jgi:molecular chaperone GrpE
MFWQKKAPPGMENKDTLTNEAQSLADQPDIIVESAPTDSTTPNTGDPGTNYSFLQDETATESQPDVAEPDSPPTQADAAAQEIAELKEKYLRLYADFENFRRRTAREKLDLINTASEGVLVALLPVVDDFDRAMQSLEATTDLTALKEGVSLIHNKLTRTLEGKGLKPMVAKGEVFNADLHESVTQFPAPTEDMKGRVIDEVERGYLLNDKVIRFAKVIVGA